jgi:hypothetical protein
VPRTIEQGFADFLLKLRATAPETTAAKNHRASIEACLKSNFGLLRFFRIGSFGNGTSISGYSDVDYLASIPTDQLTQTSTASLVKVRDALDRRFPNTGVSVDCPAVVVPFGTYRSETTEIVPADYITKDSFKVYEIADCNGDWMKVSPEAHNAYVNMIDRKHSGQVKPLIRYVKAWKFYRNAPIASFYLELFTARYANSESAIIYSIDVGRVLRRLYKSGLADLPDPMGVSGSISACRSAYAKQDALSKLETAATRAEKAYAAEADHEIGEAFGWWRLLYNDRFPAYYYS